MANAALRDLARSLYPIVLTERGLAAALQALTARAPMPVSLLELPRRRFGALAEATAYFAVADMLATARTQRGDGDDRRQGRQLVVEVRVDGRAEAPPGLTERVAAVGGRLVIEGPAVRAELPVER